MKTPENISSQEDVINESHTEKVELDMCWETGEKSKVVTPHLWNDYAGIDQDVEGVLDREPKIHGAPVPYHGGEYLHELAYGDERPLRVEERWKRFPHDTPTETLSDQDKRKVQYLDQLSDEIASLQQELRDMTSVIPIKDPEGKKRPWGKRAGLQEPYASKTFEFDFNSLEFEEKKDEIFSLVQKIKDRVETARKFFYPNKEE